MCHIASDLASIQGRAPEHRVSYGTKFYLSTGKAPVLPPHVLRFLVDHGS
jgi:hypothetical protein